MHVFAQEMNMNESAGSINMTGGQAINATESPAIYTLPNSKMQIKMTWQPEAINTNDSTKFTFEFIDTDTEQLVQNISFTAHMSLAGKSMVHKHEVTAPNGIATINQKFDSRGSLLIIIDSIKVGNTSIADLAQFSLNVLPEFPIGIALVAVTMIGVAVLAPKLVHLRKE